MGHCSTIKPVRIYLTSANHSLIRVWIKLSRDFGHILQREAQHPTLTLM